LKTLLTSSALYVFVNIYNRLQWKKN